MKKIFLILALITMTLDVNAVGPGRALLQREVVDLALKTLRVRSRVQEDTSLLMRTLDTRGGLLGSPKYGQSELTTVAPLKEELPLWMFMQPTDSSRPSFTGDSAIITRPSSCRTIFGFQAALQNPFCFLDSRRNFFTGIQKEAFSSEKPITHRFDVITGTSIRRYSTIIDDGLHILKLFKEGNPDGIEYALTHEEDRENVDIFQQKTANYNQKISYIERVWGIFEDDSFSKFRRLLKHRDKSLDIVGGLPSIVPLRGELSVLKQENSQIDRQYKELFASINNFPEKLNKFSSLNNRVKEADKIRERFQRIKHKVEGLSSDIDSIDNQIITLEEANKENSKLVEKKDDEVERRMTYSQEIGDLERQISNFLKTLITKKESLLFVQKIPDDSIKKYEVKIRDSIDSIDTMIGNLKKLASDNEENKNKAIKLETQFKDLREMEAELDLFIEHNKFNVILKQKIEIIKEELGFIRKKIEKFQKSMSADSNCFETLKKECISTLSSQNAHDFEFDPFYEIAGIKTIRILSIDGGGVRGILPTQVLAKIEDETNRAIAEQFDVITGTSVGGLLSLALSVPNIHPNEGGALKNKSSELLQNATNDARDIFPYRLSKIKAFWKLSLAKIGDFFGYQTAFAKGEEGLYSKRGIKRIVENYLGDALLGDSFSTVFIPAATVKRNQKQDSHLYFFSSQNPMHKGLKMKDIARATTAAPLIFASHKIKELFPITTSDGEVEARFVDGGLIANNPTKLAYEEASRLFEGPLRFLIVSIGTGENELDLSKPTNVMEMFSCTMRRQSELTHNDLNVIFKNRELGIYKRLQFVLEQKISLEDTRDETLAYLARVGEDGIKNVHAKDIKEIVDILKQKRTYGTPGKLILKPKSFDEDLENNTSCDR